MTQRTAGPASTRPWNTIRPRPDGRCMAQAVRAGMLASARLLACNHERVDLGGSGAGGSTVFPMAGGPPLSRVREPADSFITSLPPPAAPSGTPGGAKPSFAGLASLPQLVPPISGGTLAVAADGSIAVAADAERDLIYLVDITTDDTQIIGLPAGSEPGRVVLDDQGRAHVVLRNAGKLARIDLKTARIELSEPVCQHPRGLARSAATLHVACADGQLVQLNAATYEILERTQSPLPDLRDVALDASGKPVVSRFRDASFWLPERAHDEITLPALPWPVLDVSSTSAQPARWLSTRATLAFRTLSAPDGSVWMLHERAQIDALDGDDYRGSTTQCGPAVQAALTQLDPQTGAIQRSLQVQGVSAPAVDLAISAGGTWLAVATPSAFAEGKAGVQLYRISTLMNEARIERKVNAEFPDSAAILCATPSSTGIALDTQALAVAFDGQEVLYVQGRYPAHLHVIGATANNARGNRVLRMNQDPPRDLGHEWFHAEIAGGGVSCAACHAEGLDDAHVWHFSKGLRRTPNLRGGLSQTAPYAWGGEHTSLDSAITSFTFPSVSRDILSGIGAWLDRLAPLTLEPAADAMSGKELFESAQLGCSECHSGPKLTNNRTVDIGTGGAFQVPSLLGLGLRAPYMHDGCAADLHAFLTNPSCTGHTQLSTLRDEQAAALQAYLRSL